MRKKTTCNQQHRSFHTLLKSHICVSTTKKFTLQTSYLHIPKQYTAGTGKIWIEYYTDNFIPTACALIYIIQNQQPRFQFRIEFYFYAKEKKTKKSRVQYLFVYRARCAVFCVSSVLTHKTNKSIFLSMVRNTLKRCTRECKARRLENC